MKYTMQTESGAVYAIDEEALTWRRVGTVPVHGLERNEGKLTDEVDAIIGQRARIWDAEVGPITTTRVVRLELTA